MVVSLPCTNLDSAAKRLKESDLVVTHPGNSFGSSSDFKTQKQHPKMLTKYSIFHLA